MEIQDGGHVYSSPAIAGDGTVYVGTWDNKVDALDGTTGAMRWNFTTGDVVFSSPAIGANGTVYVGLEDGAVYALTAATPSLTDSATQTSSASPAYKLIANNRGDGLCDVDDDSIDVTDVVGTANDKLHADEYDGRLDDRNGDDVYDYRFIRGDCDRICDSDTVNFVNDFIDTYIDAHGDYLEVVDARNGYIGVQDTHHLVQQVVNAHADGHKDVDSLVHAEAHADDLADSQPRTRTRAHNRARNAGTRSDSRTPSATKSGSRTRVPSTSTSASRKAKLLR